MNTEHMASFIIATHSALSLETENDILLPSIEDNWALFFDIDGTLSSLAPNPEEAFIPPSILNALLVFQQELGSVALISGRCLTSIDRMSAPYHFAAAGQHGLEIRGAECTLIPIDTNKKSLLEPLYNLVEELHSEHPELFIEYKGMSIAVHYRQIPELENTVRTLMAKFAYSSPELEIQEGKKVCEVKLRGANKGTAIELLMKQEPFLEKIPVFFGDDITDEEGFSTVNRLGGITCKIGSGRSCAHYRMKNIFELHAWISTQVTQLKKERKVT